METATGIIKDLLFPRLEKDLNFRQQQLDDVFWFKFTEAFLDYEIDPKPVFASVYRLELENPERIIGKLPEIHRSFTEELAEQYVLNNRSEAIERLHQNGDSLFRENVSFLRELRNAVYRMERRRIINEMPLTYASLSGEIPEESIESAIKKKGREELRAKFRKWDGEKKEELNVVSSNIRFSMESYHNSGGEDKEENNSESSHQKVNGKVISLSWIKYAAAACVLITAGLFYFNSLENGISSDIEIVDMNDEEESKMEEENIQLADLKASSKNLEVLQNAGLGYSETLSDKSVKVTFIDADERISSLYEILKEKEFDTSTYKDELSRLQNSQGKYIFKDQQLTFYKKGFNENLKIIELSENQYYFQKGNEFYQLKISDAPQELSPETNENVIEQLDKIIFINE